MQPANIENARFGRLAVGDVPRVVGTLTTFEALCSFADRYSTQCDIAEIRLDLIGEQSDWQVPARRIQQAGTPVLLTLRSVAEGGQSRITPLAAIESIGSGWDALDAIDLEHQQEEARQAAAIARRSGKAVIASFHDFAGTPTRERLAEIVETAAEYADVVKVSTMAHSLSDIGRLKELLCAPHGKPLCVIGMGPEGTATRTDFPSLGSCLTYGYLDAPAAPGQLSAAALVEHLTLALPRYRECRLQGGRS